MMFDAAPSTIPHDVGAELAVIAGVMLDNERMRECSVLVPGDFFSASNQAVWKSVLALYSGGVPIDTVTLRAHLVETGRLQGAGGDEKILALTSVVPNVHNIGEHVAIVRRKSTERQAIALVQAAGASARNGAAEAAARDLEAARALLLSTTSSGLAEQWLTLGERGPWLEEKPPPRDWLLKRGETPVLGRGVVGLLVAPGGRGKSYTLCDLAIAVATGTPWLGAIDVASPGNVVLALAEEDTAEVRRRLYAVAEARRMTRDEMNLAYQRIVPLGLMGQHVSLASVDGTTVTPSASHAELLRLLSQREYAAVLLDPMSRWAGGLESDNNLATRGIQLFEQLAEASKATVIVAHHTSKLSRREGSGDHGSAARGVTGITDGVRWVVELLGKGEDDLELAVTKTNGAPRTEPVPLVREESGAIRAKTPAELAADLRGEKVTSVHDDAVRLVHALRTHLEPVTTMRALRGLAKGRMERRTATIKHATEQGWIAADARGQWTVTEQAPTLMSVAPSGVSQEDDEWGG